MDWLRAVPRRVKIAFSIIYFAGITYAVFFARRRWHYYVRSVTLTPLKSTIRQYRQMGHSNPFKFYTDFFGNILVFVPLCFALRVFLPRIRSAQVVLVGFLLSMSIEILQYIFAVGYTEMDDLILNTFGAAIGVWLYDKIC